MRAPIPIEFPSEETAPVTKRHLETRTTLYLLFQEALPGAAVGSDQFLYWDAADPQKRLSPDVFLKRGAPNEIFDNWKIWERGAPDLAIEIVSDTDRRESAWQEKLARYRATGITEVVRFDAETPDRPLRIWDRIEGDLVERSPQSPDFHECTTLNLWWFILPSPAGPMPRLARDREGTTLLPTPAEERIRLTAALQSSEAEIRRLRAELEKRGPTQ
ncbi:MAG: Uma2 family endonuclease [Polyangiaceae bacterium]